MIMALRFFFGNNNYIAGIFSKPSSTISRLYHFTVISGQSLILLGSSFLIRNPHKFALWIAGLFLSEVLWYIGCMIFFKEAISNEAGQLDRLLRVNEAANLAMTLAAGIAGSIKPLSPGTAIYIVTAVFICNSVVDLRVNLKKYMGAP